MQRQQSTDAQPVVRRLPLFLPSPCLDWQDSGTTRLLTLPYLEPLEGTLDGWLLNQWCAQGGLGLPAEQ